VLEKGASVNDPNKQSGSSPTRKTDSPPADFFLENHGSVLLLRPQTVSARIWVDDHIGRENGYQPYWPSVVIEHRYIADIIAGIQGDGLAVQL
jgi:hypothetical protein